ncbi:MAG: discoidin domain-containing protein, partial [Bifidobacteriaceae bacterium]|nr:discoidin domain-containing protein [Bifidobacteriaceae bacterium]
MGNVLAKAGGKRLVALAATVALAVPLASGPQGAAAASGAAAAQGGRIAEAGGVTLPGLAPGDPLVVVDEELVTLDNQVLGASFTVGEHGAALTRLENKQTAEDLPVASSGFFSMTLAGGAVIGDADLELASGPELADLAAEPDAPRVAERSAGKAVSAKWQYASADVDFDLDWTVELRHDSNSVEQFFTITPTRGTLSYTSTKLLNLQGVSNARRSSANAGNPVVAGGAGSSGTVLTGTFFLGWENPQAVTTGASGLVAATLGRSNPLVAGAETGSSVTESIGIGVSVEGQLRRAFEYYVQRERCHERRTELQYNGWYDLSYENKMRVYKEELDHAITLFGTEMVTERGANVDSFHVDDGWDYYRQPAMTPDPGKTLDETEADRGLTIWSVDPVQFPDGFDDEAALAESFGAEMAAWMSPKGGYNPGYSQRVAFNNALPGGATPYSFTLTDSRYYQAFRDRAIDLVDNEGINGFKFDGTAGGDFELMLALNRELREHSPDIFIYQTSGTWASPYFLWYVDTIWRQGTDCWGDAGPGDLAQGNVTYRDQIANQYYRQGSPLFPITELMYHGLIWSSNGYAGAHARPESFDLKLASTQKELKQLVKATFGLGTSLVEIMTQTSLVDTAGHSENEFYWDVLADNAKWHYENIGLLSDNHYIGPAPNSGEVYGTAAWNALDGGQGIVMLRNPSTEPKLYTLDVSSAFELPAGYTSRYKFTERDGEADEFVTDRYHQYTLMLEPFEVLIFEAEPTAESITASPASFTYSETTTTVETLDRSGWTASADSEAPCAEQSGMASDAIDNDQTTMWHSEYCGYASQKGLPYPHWLAVDTGSDETTFDSLTYRARPDTAANGRIADYQIQISDDGESWDTVASGTFGAGYDEVVVLEEAVTARWFRIYATSARNGLDFAAATEVNLGFANSVTEVTELAAPVPGGSDEACRANTAAWTAEADTEEVSNESGRAANALDGNTSTIWHSRYTGGNAPYPHWLTVDAQAPVTWEAYEFVPRQDNSANGYIKDVELLVSLDGQNWDSVATASRAKTLSSWRVEPAEPMTSRYFKLYATSATNGLAFAAAAEINVYAAKVGGFCPAPAEAGFAIADPSDGTATDLQIGVDGETIEAGGTLALADIPAAAGWFHVALQPGAISLGWVKGDAAVVDIPSDLPAGDYTVVVQDDAGNLAGMGTVHNQAGAVVNKTDLSALVAGASALVPGYYTSGSWSVLESALSAAQVVLADDAADQASVDGAAAALELAWDGLAAGEVQPLVSVDFRGLSRQEVRDAGWAVVNENPENIAFGDAGVSVTAEAGELWGSNEGEPRNILRHSAPCDWDARVHVSTTALDQNNEQALIGVFGDVDNYVKLTRAWEDSQCVQMVV